MEPMATIHPAAEVRDIMTAQVHTLQIPAPLQ
jgi:hypothetical protein